MPFDSTTPQQIRQITAYVCTDQGAALARDVAARSGAGDSAVHGGGLSGAARLIGDVPAADIILAEIGNIPVQMACECVHEICGTGAHIIVLGAQTDIATYRAVRTAGALEYFTFPVSADDILAVQPGAPQAPAVPTPDAPALCPSVAVMGCNGGVGASLLAQNLAHHAASLKATPMCTALLDADVQFGSQAIDLDRDETAGLFEALKAPERVDATFFGATMDHLNDHLSLYSHQVRSGQDPRSLEAGMARLMAPMRKDFDLLVTDLPRHMILQHPDVMAQIDTLILLIPAGFAGVNAATRLIDRITAQAPDLRILPVLSNLRADAGLSRKDVTATIGRPIAAILPGSEKALMRAHRAARPLIQYQPRGAYAKAVQSLWAAAITRPASSDKPTRKPFLKRIFA